MTKLTMLLIVAALGFPLHAASMHFGSEEKIYEISDIKDTEYAIGYKLTFHYFVMGTHFSDDGYVIKKKTSSNKYIPLNTETQKAFGDKFPSSLPGYSISIWSYIWGYSLWISLAIIMMISLIKFAVKRKGKSAQQVDSAEAATND